MLNDSTLIERGAIESMRLLKRNLTPQGILAASAGEKADKRRYTRIFGRDAAICALGMVVSQDDELIRGAHHGLITLAHHQAANGQIPKYVSPQGSEADFWYLGCIDATLWWLIAVRFCDRHHPQAGLEASLQTAIDKAINWLRCQEHPRLFLVQQNEASDWADIMPRSGFVLYTNALWYHVKQLYGLADAEQTKYHFNHLFYPFSRHIPDYRRLRLLTHYVRNKANYHALYLSFVNFSFWGDEGDVFGNLLAIVLGLANEDPAYRILRELDDARATTPYPVRAVITPIEPNDPLWRGYMERHQQNLAYQYHNGGVWPFIGAFLVIALARLGKPREARVVLARLAKANQLDDWAFNEWLHGETGTPGGMPGQSWNAAMFLLARHALKERVF